MKSLKECYEIAKQYHKYWAKDAFEIRTRYMCFAAKFAHSYEKLTTEEYHMLLADIGSLVRAMDSESTSLGNALVQIGVLSESDSCTEAHKVIKEFWDNYIDRMENQDG